MTTMTTELPSKWLTGRYLALMTTAIVVGILAMVLVGSAVFRSPLPDWAATKSEVQELNLYQLLYVNFVASQQVEYSEPLNYEEKQRLVLGAANEVCSSYHIFGTPTFDDKLRVGELFPYHGYSSSASEAKEWLDRQDTFISTVEEQFC